MTQTLIAMVPSAAFVGEPMVVTREMSETEVYQERLRKLPIETKEYLGKAWLEIKETECYQDYGLPREGILSVTNQLFRLRCAVPVIVYHKRLLIAYSGQIRT